MGEEKTLWGGETEKAIGNFPVSGEPIPAPVAHWLGRIKAAAARANADLELLDAEMASRIAAAGDRVAAGEFDDQFPIDVFQTGSGTSSNMNANEVIANLAGDDVHANDHVNMGQSSNDVFPSAVHLAALGEIAHDLLPALERLAASLERKAFEFDGVVKSGRTHWMDAVPVTLGQEFAGYAAQVRQGIARVEDAQPRLGQIPLGGTATGTGLNTHPEFAARVREYLSRETGLTVSAPVDHFEAQAARDGLVEASGALKVVAVSLTKIANDLRFMGSGPRAGLGELFLPELQKGSSIMPGKVNPVIPEVVTQVAAQVIGNDTAITIGGMNGHFELNVYIPLMARNLLQSIDLLASASRLLAEKCVDGIEANREQCERYAELTLSAATALNPYIGYDKASELVKAASSSGRSLREVALEAGVEESVLDDALDYARDGEAARLGRAPSGGSPGGCDRRQNGRLARGQDRAQLSPASPGAGRPDEDGVADRRPHGRERDGEPPQGAGDGLAAPDAVRAGEEDGHVLADLEPPASDRQRRPEQHLQRGLLPDADPERFGTGPGTRGPGGGETHDERNRQRCTGHEVTIARPEPGGRQRLTPGRRVLQASVA